MKPAKILYFVDGHAPKPEDFQAAAEMAATVVFRNARAVPSEPHSLEICDGVAGKVPALYAEKFPTAEEAISKKKKELKELSSKVGDSPAPKASGKGAAAKTDDTKAPASGNAPAPAATGQAPGWNPNPASGNAPAPAATGQAPGWNPNPAQQ